MAAVPDNPRFRLGARDTFRVLWPYVSRNFMNQLSGIWFIVAYLIVFQWLVLQLPIVFAGMIAFGIFIVALGLMFFMEGLRLGLMPLGEVIGSVLPKDGRMWVILAFAFLLGVGATLAEPAIAVLRAAGSTVQPQEAPLLYAMLNDYAGQLVAAVGIGVGIAVLLGVLRFFYAWPLKYLAMPSVALLLALSVYFSRVPELADVLGLAWDSGAVTTGPVTVPLVLALGIGVCRVVSSGSDGGGHTGFGIVTMASLLPILAVMCLALVHYAGGDDVRIAQSPASTETVGAVENIDSEQFSAGDSIPIDEAEYRAYLESGRLPDGYELHFDGGTPELVDGVIVITEPDVVIRNAYQREFALVSEESWDESRTFMDQLGAAAIDALRAIIPLCLFLYLVLRWLLRKRLDEGADVGIGVAFAFLGMALFGLGIALGLTPLGGQLGSNIPLTFAEIVPWGGQRAEAPMSAETLGKLVAVGFAFFLGYGATLAEPALNAIGDTVERITVGAFRKRLLMQSVAIGVGFGIAAGIVKMAYNLPLIWMLVPPYLLVLLLTWKAPHEFVNFAWDSAGVTTGPISVPLVLAMGLGIGANVPGAAGGFGVLALASVGPILTVLAMGLYTQRQQRAELATEESADEPAPKLAHARAAS